MLRLRSKTKKVATAALAFLASFSLALPTALPINAADHAESTSVAGDPGADIADVFAFLDPSDNSKVVLAMDVEGFVVPSELLNLSFFAPDVRYRFEIENTGDAIPDQRIDVTFSPQISRSQPQMATIRLPHGQMFTAPTTVQTLAPAANPFVVTTDPASGVSFFAGLTDDPFFFDIVGFNRFVSSVLAGAPDPTKLQRNRDSFAGYNIHMIALSVPAWMLRGRADNNVIGVNGVTLRRKNSHREESEDGEREGKLVQVDRMATPAVNTALIPFPRKNEYNAATPVDDAAGRFAGSIVGTLTALGTNATNIGILANVAVVRGDYLRLDLSKPNASVGFGENITTPNYTGFPNGRRPGDDTINTLLYFITNQSGIQEAVNHNDVPLGSTFPFFAPPNQPLENPAIDNTMN
ncbi:MAG TPA: DUF4331 family protein [Candidatus Acidoferrum sp.]|nr:DUF4331 family protein [Candidatus Acidoferrum sp.]